MISVTQITCNRRESPPRDVNAGGMDLLLSPLRQSSWSSWDGNSVSCMGTRKCPLSNPGRITGSPNDATDSPTLFPYFVPFQYKFCSLQSQSLLLMLTRVDRSPSLFSLFSFRFSTYLYKNIVTCTLTFR